MNFGPMYDMNQLFRLVQAVIPILTCEKKIFFIRLSFYKKKYIWSTKISFGDSPAETKKKNKKK
jgi:hypothetical protein